MVEIVFQPVLLNWDPFLPSQMKARKYIHVTSDALDKYTDYLQQWKAIAQPIQFSATATLRKGLLDINLEIEADG